MELNQALCPSVVYSRSTKKVWAEGGLGQSGSVGIRRHGHMNYEDVNDALEIRNSEPLLRVPTGTIVYSDCWKVYNRLS